MRFVIKLQPSGEEYQCDPEKTLLAAGMDAGLSLPYSCRAGHCHTCIARVVDGEVDEGDTLSPLSEKLRAEQRILLCQAKPCSNLTLRVEQPPKVSKPRRVPCRVKQIHKPVPDVAIVTVRLPMNEDLKFSAGQFVELLLPNGQTRNYSIASVPRTGGVVELDFHIRHVPGGLFTDQLFSTNLEGKILQLRAPLGSFFLREDDKPALLIATGTGFAPVKSMIEHAISTDAKRKLVLYWGGRRPTDLYMQDLAQSWEAQLENFQFVPVVSDEMVNDKWNGRRGYVHEAVMHDIPDLSGWQVYACGSPAMVDAAKQGFTTACGLPDSAFYADAFLTMADREPTNLKHIGP